jgi:hypothetical protein
MKACTVRRHARAELQPGGSPFGLLEARAAHGHPRGLCSFTHNHGKLIVRSTVSILLKIAKHREPRAPRRSKPSWALASSIFPDRDLVCGVHHGRHPCCGDPGSAEGRSHDGLHRLGGTPGPWPRPSCFLVSISDSSSLSEIVILPSLLPPQLRRYGAPSLSLSLRIRYEEAQVAHLQLQRQPQLQHQAQLQQAGPARSPMSSLLALAADVLSALGRGHGYQRPSGGLTEWLS